MLARLARVLVLLLSAPVALADGNVTMEVTPGGDLLVLGDGNDNRVAFDSESGFLALTHVGGTLNGGPSTAAVPPFTGRAIIDLAGGDDAFNIVQTGVADVVLIQLGEGNDFCDVESGGDVLAIWLGDGDDFVNVESSGFDRTSIHGGDGDDRISFFFAGADELTIHAGAGNDHVSVRFGSIDVAAKLHGGSGTDALFLEDPGFASPPKVIGFETRQM